MFSLKRLGFVHPRSRQLFPTLLKVWNEISLLVTQYYGDGSGYISFKSRRWTLFYFFFVSFRSDWLIERQGKWAEPDYPGVTYPVFACGAGNVLSADIVHWLARNADSLKRYQVILHY